MITNQKLHGDTKFSVVDNNKASKKAIKNAVPKKTSFIPNFQTSISSQDVIQSSFIILTGQSLSITSPKRITFKE